MLKFPEGVKIYFEWSQNLSKKGMMGIEVEAASEKEAIKKAREEISESDLGEWELDESDSDIDIWDMDS
jgi:hypothetical protein